jgi:hypothetical protein
MAVQPTNPYTIEEYIAHFAGLDAPEALPSIARRDVDGLRETDLAEMDVWWLRDRLARTAGMLAVLVGEQAER